jgi:hypothetical protein
VWKKYRGYKCSKEHCGIGEGDGGGEDNGSHILTLFWNAT